ncbi:sulfatase [Croceitalea sp. P059]|uniref:sulfatase family protein n=1 Tax=Croceitalea sp. P059 TaxID=3075601 RepID=UPI002884515E|nr:sulfatase [Croceitalea sp. P059]MDT0539087.1 sulfatase [Croceitalea sp. P059]
MYRSIFLLVFTLLISCQKRINKIPKSDSLPNIVLIFTDDQGYQDVGVFGSPNIRTPHLNKMASEGLKLTNFYAAQAVCSASRAAILTGCYPNRISIHGALMPNAKIGLAHQEVTIAEMLQQKGYATGIFGKWHLGDHPDYMPLNHGFDEFFGIPYSNDMWPNHPQQGPIFDFDPLPLYENEVVIDTLTDQSNLTTQITQKSVEFIKRNKDKPFFLYVPHPQPHVPLFVSDKFKGRSERGLYGDVIMEIDWSVGQIMKTLKDAHIDDNTLVIFTSDNGPWLAYGNHSGSAKPLREGKGTAWEGGQREPFIAHFPGKIPSGTTLKTPLMAIDILPTLAEMVGADLPINEIDGKSAWRLFKGETEKSPQDVYFFYYKKNELHGVRYGKWKLYFPHSYRTMRGQEPGKDGLPGEYKIIGIKEIELYDLENDISETKNLALEKPEVVAKIKLLANDMRSQLGDALLELEGSETRLAGQLKE